MIKGITTRCCNEVANVLSLLVDVRALIVVFIVNIVEIAEGLDLVLLLFTVQNDIFGTRVEQVLEDNK